MTKFKNGDVLIHNNDHSAELIFMSYIPKSDGSFIAWSDDENDYDVYAEVQWKIKPKKEKRWIAVWSDGHVYHSYHQNKDVLKSWIIGERDDEYADKAQYIQIEVEV